MGAKATGLTELIDDFQKARDNVIADTKKIVGQGCLNIKKDAKKRISGYAHLPHYPRSIDYTVTVAGTVVTGEVGPTRSKLQGGLGRVIELGTVNNAPLPHLSPALDAEQPAFERYLGEMAAALLEGQATPDGPVTDPGT